MTTLRYTDLNSALKASSTWVFVGTKARLGQGDVLDALPASVQGAWASMLAGADAGDSGAVVASWSNASGPERCVACVLPDSASRHNSPAHPHAISNLLGEAIEPKAKSAVVLALADGAHAFSAGCAVARILPLYSGKGAAAQAKAKPEGHVDVALLSPSVLEDNHLDRLSAAAEGIRLAARLTDMPTSVLHTDAFLEELQSIAKDAGASIEVIRDRELEQRGYGGLWNVGKTAIHPPALVVLSHAPKHATQTVVWVGKGIVYDTGGLSLKGKDHMPGMKTDMGGAAAVAGAFQAAVRLGFPQRLHAIFCLAENAVGPQALRPDDIISMYSGKTVEVNNTDAEGRLVLADGVAHAAAHLAPDVIVDLATLTGAQLVATGRRHAGVVTNDADLEQRVVVAGRESGDLVHPLPYCPEFFRTEFKSRVADMKNSVKDRANAQSSCAAQFVGDHLGPFEGPWLHIDMAGPSGREERGTGYGVALLLQLFAD